MNNLDKQATPPSTTAAAAPMSDDERRRRWAVKALADNLDNLAIEAGKGISLGEPGNILYKRFLKLAGILNGDGKDHITYDVMISKIVRAMPDYKERDIEYQFGRALKAARPSYLKALHNQPQSRKNGAAAVAAVNGAGPQPPPAKKKKDFNAHAYAKTRDYINAFKWLEYNIQLNEMSDRIYVNGEAINDITRAEVVNRMLDLGFTSQQRIDLAMKTAGAKQSFHPLRDYFNRLEWDRRGWIDFYIDEYMDIDPEHMPWAARFIKKFLVGAVAKVLKPGEVTNMMLVIDGPQNIGKSTFVHWLCPSDLYFVEGALRTDSKDTFFRACENLIWEVSELQATTRRADVEALKSFITTKFFKERRAFGHFDVQKPVLCSFIGTMNENGGGFLTDPTGNRRYMVFKLNRFKKDQRTKEHYISVDKLWAEAVALYKSGFSWELTKEELLAQSIIQERYKMTSPYHDALWEIVTATDSEDDFISSTALRKAVKDHGGLRGSDRLADIEIKKAMISIGINQSRKRENNGRIRGYRGIKFINPLHSAL